MENRKPRALHQPAPPRCRAVPGSCVTLGIGKQCSPSPQVVGYQRVILKPCRCSADPVSQICPGPDLGIPVTMVGPLDLMLAFQFLGRVTVNPRTKSFKPLQALQTQKSRKILYPPSVTHLKDLAFKIFFSFFLFSIFINISSYGG